MENDKIFSAISELNEAYKEYYNTSTESKFDLQKFSLWLFNSETERKNKNSKNIYKSEMLNTVSLHGDIDDQISFILLNLNRLIKFYVKKAIEKTKLVSIDDIHFLLYLAHNESMRKSEVISSNITEMSSGIEVIKRLIKNELVVDFDDPDDKRSKRVKITSKGMEEVEKIRVTFQNIHKFITSPLAESEKFPLLSSINKLHNFHYNIFNNEKNSSLEEVMKKYFATEDKVI